MDIVTDLSKFVERTPEISVTEDRKLLLEIVNKLKDTLLEKNLISLSAPQIGYPYRVIAVRFFKKAAKPDIRIYINPMISQSKGFTLVRQKCESMPDREFIHPRSTEINMMYQTPEGGSFGSSFKGNVAFLLQQQVDLLDGITLDTMGLEIDERFDKAPEEEKNELLEAYMRYVEGYKNQLMEDIKNNPDLSAINNAAKFMSSVDAGEIKLGSEITVERPKND